MCGAKRHVRFTPNSGHVHRTGACPLSAKSGHRGIHSITFSARASTNEAMVKPRAFEPFHGTKRRRLAYARSMTH